MKSTKSSLGSFILCFSIIFLGQNLTKAAVQPECGTHWGSSSGSLDSLRPAGKEYNTILYTCRCTIGQDVIVGKVWPYPNGTTSCNGAYRGKHQYIFNYEVLRDCPETTSWVPFCGSVGETHVVGGQLNRRLVFVCRAVVHNWLIPGYYDQETKRCNVEIGLKAFGVKEDFEMLIVNKYGIVRNSKVCFHI